ncbi:hypothetical protein [Homoserinimonas hongtaonis]|uniref:Uncharacterized protein n=1 Tax=Homoserinimonas hongtaonis TaxID=2079791 RepID=A0A2U1T1T5_9MICO|nr:hypothetical protein [Salinibacterium hongtaonis]PWB97817.1 hypothetical protein DF220_08220 [Salinibacterium hongtaonis]
MSSVQQGSIYWVTMDPATPFGDEGAFRLDLREGRMRAVFERSGSVWTVYEAELEVGKPGRLHGFTGAFDLRWIPTGTITTIETIE